MEFKVQIDTFYVQQVDKTFIDLQILNMDGDVELLYTEGWYGEYSDYDLNNLVAKVTSETINKFITKG